MDFAAHAPITFLHLKQVKLPATKLLTELPPSLHSYRRRWGRPRSRSCCVGRSPSSGLSGCSRGRRRTHSGSWSRRRPNTCTHRCLACPVWDSGSLWKGHSTISGNRKSPSSPNQTVHINFNIPLPSWMWRQCQSDVGQVTFCSEFSQMVKVVSVSFVIWSLYVKWCLLWIICTNWHTRLIRRLALKVKWWIMDPWIQQQENCWNFWSFNNRSAPDMLELSVVHIGLGPTDAKLHCDQLNSMQLN